MISTPSTSASRRLDRLGVLASSLCLVHCLATPLLVASLPLLASERFEGVLAALLVGLATLSVGLSLARGRVRPLLPYGLGLGALLYLRVAEFAEGSPAELLGMVLAAVLMVCTHLLSLGQGGGRRSARGGG